jgi:hypothetical protein
MKIARLTLLVTLDFKGRLARDARRAGVGGAQPMRERFEKKQSPEEAGLRAPITELKRSTAETKAALRAASKLVQTGTRSRRAAAAPAEATR